MAAPSVSGDLQIQSLSLNSNFENLCALQFLRRIGDGFPVWNVQLSLRVFVRDRNFRSATKVARLVVRPVSRSSIKGTPRHPASDGPCVSPAAARWLVVPGTGWTVRNVTAAQYRFVNPRTPHRSPPSITAETSIRTYQCSCRFPGRMNHCMHEHERNRLFPPTTYLLGDRHLISGCKKPPTSTNSPHRNTPALDKTSNRHRQDRLTGRCRKSCLSLETGGLHARFVRGVGSCSSPEGSGTGLCESIFPLLLAPRTHHREKLRFHTGDQSSLVVNA